MRPDSKIADEQVGVIVAAAGSSRRMTGEDKIFAPLLGGPLISHSLRVFQDSPLVHSIVLVLSKQNLERGREMVQGDRWSKVVSVCRGGDRRQDSVRIGLDQLQDSGWIIVHDGARPCVRNDAVARGLSEARQTGAAVAAVPINDTVKRVGEDGLVRSTVSRDGLWTVQTPQVFSRELLAEAHRRVTEDVTDDAAMIEWIDGTIRVFPGEFENIKVTTPGDLRTAEAILAARAAAGSEGRE